MTPSQRLLEPILKLEHFLSGTILKLTAFQSILLSSGPTPINFYVWRENGIYYLNTVFPFEFCCGIIAFPSKFCVNNCSLWQMLSRLFYGLWAQKLRQLIISSSINFNPKKFKSCIINFGVSKWEARSESNDVYISKLITISFHFKLTN